MPLSDQRIKWGAIVYRWQAEDMDLRVSFARSIMPRDFFTLLALWIVRTVTAVLAFVLKPFDAIARLIGRLLTAVVVGLFVADGARRFVDSNLGAVGWDQLALVQVRLVSAYSFHTRRGAGDSCSRIHKAGAGPTQGTQLHRDGNGVAADV